MRVAQRLAHTGELARDRGHRIATAQELVAVGHQQPARHLGQVLHVAPLGPFQERPQVGGIGAPCLPGELPR